MINRLTINKQPKYILFDFDRTLIALYEDRTLLTELGQLMREFYKNYIEISQPEGKDGYFVWHDCHRIVEQTYEAKQALQINEEAEKRVTTFEQKVLSQREMFQAALDVIPEIDAMKIKLGIVSSNSTDAIKEKLEQNQLLSYFEYIFGRILPFHPDQIKPSAFPITTAIHLMEEEAADVWYVGDDLIDIHAAASAGVHCIGIATGNYSQEQLYREGAEIAFSDLHELLLYLQTEEFTVEQSKAKEVFWKEYDKIQRSRNFHVLILHGKDEIGKEVLLYQMEEDVSVREKDTVYSYYDLNNGQDPIVVLRQIAKKLQSKYQFQFSNFLYAVYQYMCKCGGKSDNPEVMALSRYVKLVSDKIHKITDFTARRKEQELISKIDNASKEKLYRDIPRIFAAELNENLDKYEKRVIVLVLNNYEKLLIELSFADTIVRNGFWLCDDKDGILPLTKGLLCVLVGQEKINQNEIDENQKDKVSQVEMDEPNAEIIQKRELLCCARIFGYKLNMSDGTVTELTKVLFSYLTDDQKDELIRLSFFDKVSNHNSISFSLDEQVRKLLLKFSEDNRIFEIMKATFASMDNMNILTTEYYKNLYSISQMCNMKNNTEITCWWMNSIYPVLTAYLDDYCLSQFCNIYKLLESITQDYRLKTLFLGYLLKKGDYDEAYSYISTYQSDDKGNLEVLQFDLAASYYHYIKGMDLEALKLRETVYQKRKQLLGNNSRETIRAGFALAASYSRVGRYEESVLLGTECRKNMDKITNFYDPLIWVSENQLGDSYFRLGKYEEAKIIYDEVYKARIKWLGKKNNSTMIAYTHIADCLVNLKEYDRAMNIYQEVRRFRANEFGRESQRKYYINEDIQFTCDHPDTILVDNNMAVCLIYMGELEEALDILKSVVVNRKLSIGDKAPSTMCSLGNQAICEYYMRQKSTAVKHITQVVNNLSEVLGDEHVDTIVSRYHKALVEENYDEVDRMICDYSERLGVYTNSISRMKAHKFIGYFSLGKYCE